MKILSFAPMLCLCTAGAFAAPPSGFDGRVESLRKDNGVPGMAIAIVENDQITLAKGFGIKRLGSPDPVDAETMMARWSASR
jgi:CubicO group peptidase (beta-lactamase class C family)